LTDEDRKRTGTDIRHVEWRHPVGMPRVRAMGDGLAELRSAVPSGHEIRLLFIVHGGEMVVLHGFIKTTKTTPKGDLDLARDRQKDWKKNSP
jgi:phage-related protein